MLRVLVPLAVACLILSASASRKHQDKAKIVEASKHKTPVSVDCALKCLPTGGAKDPCKAGVGNEDSADFCKSKCVGEGLCEENPNPAPEERQQDDSKKTDDSDEELLEEEEDKPKPPKKEERRCFPADASVETPTGPKRMSELRVGDAVQAVNGAGELYFDDVYFFGHADSAVKADYVALKLAERTLELSDRHFVPTCPDHGVPCEWARHVYAYAQEVQPGDYVWNVQDKIGVQLQMVHEAFVINKEGLFNPYTLSGKIVVNGVVASAHSEWLLDSFTPSMYTGHLPAIYQAMFLPGRWLYHIVGPAAADVLDVNNPSAQGYGTEFLVACAGLFVGILLASQTKR